MKIENGAEIKSDCPNGGQEEKIRQLEETIEEHGAENVRLVIDPLTNEVQEAFVKKDSQR